jgi:hypothetical protein
VKTKNVDEQVRDALGQAIEQALPIAERLAESRTEAHLVWYRVGDRSWKARWEQRPSLAEVFRGGENDFAEICESFNDLFLQTYPQYTGMVGLANFSRARLFANRTDLFENLLAHIYKRHGSFATGHDIIESALREFSAFVDDQTIRLRFAAPLLNFYTRVEKIELPGALSIRRLSEHEVTELYGGPIRRTNLGLNRWFSLHEFVIEGEFDEKVIFGDADADAVPSDNHVRTQLDKAMLALRTFKEGKVGFELIRFEPVAFWPEPVGQIGFGDLYVPLGSYLVNVEEVESLQCHAERIVKVSDPAMSMACSRLSDAQIRVRPEDRIVDAVIGLEALLLAGLTKDDRRGELKYRFSINYASLFDGAHVRHLAFRTAKDLYDVRSTVAHGGLIKPEGCRVGDEKLSLDDAAKRACDALRGVIAHFLSQGGQAVYKDARFWEKRYFGL